MLMTQRHIVNKQHVKVKLILHIKHEYILHWAVQANKTCKNAIVQCQEFLKLGSSAILVLKLEARISLRYLLPGWEQLFRPDTVLL